MLIFA